MKKKYILSLFLGGLLFSFSSFAAAYIIHVQKNDYIKLRNEFSNLQTEVIHLQEDIFFLKNKNRDIEFLRKKGWFTPINRLIGTELINQYQSSLNHTQFIIEPEIIIQWDERHVFRMSKIIMKIHALLDKDIFEFIDNILKHFPGVLVLRKFCILKEDNLTKSNLLALRKNKRINLVIGEITFEWLAMKD